MRRADNLPPSCEPFDAISSELVTVVKVRYNVCEDGARSALRTSTHLYACSDSKQYSFLGAFATLRKAVMSVRLHGTTRLPMDFHET